MNWEAMGAVGEVLGAVGVLASLVYLAIQIRQNTKMMKATIRQQLTMGSQQTTLAIGDRAERAWKMMSGAEVTPAERLQISMGLRTNFRGYENYVYQREKGLLDESEWRGILENMRRFLAVPMVREEWLVQRDEYSETLQRIVDPLVAEAERAS